MSSKPSNYKSGEAGGGTGYAGDGNDKKQRAAGRKKAQAKEAQDEKSQCQLLQQALRLLQSSSSSSSASSPPPTESILTLMRQVLRNFGIPADEKKAKQHGQLMDWTLQIVENILQKHPKSIGCLHSGDDSLLLALQEAAKKSQMMVTHPEGSSNLELQHAQLVLDLFPRARTTSQHTYVAPDIMVTDSQDNYRQALRPYAFAFCEELPHHHFRGSSRSLSSSTTTGGGGNTFTTSSILLPHLIPHTQNNNSHISANNIMSGMQRKRLFQELSNYQTNLPIEFGSSILVRAMEGSMDYIRVMIIGPEDTPYANGCFFFDLFLQDYPNTPPKVQFLTTGGGKYRFNPNLYECGKVCLSLLGTWQGPSWEPNQSTLYQLLISIQSLILGESEPYFNEPGFELQRNTAVGKAQSQQYNQRIQNYTCAAAILPFLKRGGDDGDDVNNNNNKNNKTLYPEFQEAIDLHFRLKQNRLLEQLQRWDQYEPAPPQASVPRRHHHLLDSSSSSNSRELVRQCLNMMLSRTLPLVDKSDVMIVAGPTTTASSSITELQTPTPKRRRTNPTNKTMPCASMVAGGTFETPLVIPIDLDAANPEPPKHNPATSSPAAAAASTGGTSGTPVVISIDLLDDDEECDIQQAIIRASLNATTKGSSSCTSSSPCAAAAVTMSKSQHDTAIDEEKKADEQTNTSSTADEDRKLPFQVIADENHEADDDDDGDNEQLQRAIQASIGSPPTTSRSSAGPKNAASTSMARQAATTTTTSTDHPTDQRLPAKQMRSQPPPEAEVIVLDNSSDEE